MAQQLKSPSESTSLLHSKLTLTTDSSQQMNSNLGVCSPQLKHLCLPSKAAILILLWTAVVGMMYQAVISLIALFVVIYPYNNKLTVHHALCYAVLAVVMMFYPLSGFIADVCCGRMKTIVVSLIVLLTSLIIFMVGVLYWMVLSIRIKSISLDSDQGILLFILVSIFVLSFIVVLIIYQANFIQLGLDQLFEAPSQYLALFIHYATLVFHSGSVPIVTVILLYLCNSSKHSATYSIVLLSITFVLLLTLIVLLVISYWKRHWFYSEPGRSNPYKTVYDIIKFVKNHKYPLRRSAFTYGDRYIPSRLDFAKERYGGPFTTEQVENVKTLMRILLILFAIGPAYALEVPASFFVFPLFGIHSLHYYKKQLCSRVWEMLMESGSMMAILTIVIVFPVYIWFAFSQLRKRIPKVFLRLGVGIVICLLGVLSLLIVDVVGHSMNKSYETNQTQCVFRASLTSSNSFPTLKLHWAVLIPPNLLLGIGPLLVVATTFEFISAQSPQSMKGLLVGVFFAIRGLFQFLNSIIIIPLSLKQPWASERMLEHPPVTNCGFVYLLLTCVSGLIGLILFSVAAKKYKYRRRDEGMFRQQDVEEIYDRYLPQPAVDDLSYEN